MRLNAFSFHSRQEDYLAFIGVLEIFRSAEIMERIDENNFDMSYAKIGAKDIKPAYAKLPKKDLAYVLEGRIIDILEDLLWGHRFVVDVKIHQYDHHGDYEFYVHIMPLREGLIYG